MRACLDRIAAFCGAAFFAAGCAAPAGIRTATVAASVPPSPSRLELDQTADSREFRVAVGETIGLALHENPTTGFRWELSVQAESVQAESVQAPRAESADAPSAEKPGAAAHPVCTVKDEGFAESATGGVGKGGTRRWLLTAAAPGSCRIALVHRRAWEQREPERSLHFSVLVAP